MIASVVYLNFLDVIDATRDAVWAAFFGANIRFATEGVDYFALGESPSPVQHYWSLAVEEQFYIVWPILVAPRRPGHPRLRRRAVDADGQRVKRTAPVRTMAFFALLVGGASLAWSVHRTVEEPTSAYFSTFTRAWELAAGVLVALALHHRAGLRWRWLNELLAARRPGGIVVAVIAYDTTHGVPRLRGPAAGALDRGADPRPAPRRAASRWSAAPSTSSRCARSATGPTRSTCGTGRSS